VTADPLFVGATRPAMALGVPYAALLANAFLTLELFLVTRNLLLLLIALPLHGLAWLVCLAEPRAFELLAVWAQVRARAGFRGRQRWQTVSYGAFRPSKPDGRAQQPWPVVDWRGRQ
jgi:type IV secretion system protein VirB3